MSRTHLPDQTEMRVLHLAPRICWPLNTGAKLRNYHLARQIARHASITLLAFSEDGARPGEIQRLGGVRSAADSHDSTASQQNNTQTESVLPPPESFYERVITLGRGRGYTPGKIIRGAVGRTPLPVLNYTTLEMKRELARLLDEENFDIVQIESIHLMNYLPVIRAARSRPLVICDWHNIESELIGRYAEHAQDALRRLYARRTSRQLAAVERRAMREFDAHIVVSSLEREQLLKDAPGARVHLIENGVDTEHYAEERVAQAHSEWRARAKGQNGSARGAGSESLRRVLFVGSMDYHANIDAVTHFAREVWPGLRELHPELVFTIVGRDPSAEVKQLAAAPGVEVTGTVDDVRPYYYDAVLAVVPLRVGGGSRLKILEAMAAGVAVVSTCLGAEGIEASDGENIVLADTNDELRASISALVENDERRRALAEGGRALVFAQYDWSRLGTMLVRIYRDLLQERETPAESNAKS